MHQVTLQLGIVLLGIPVTSKMIQKSHPHNIIILIVGIMIVPVMKQRLWQFEKPSHSSTHRLFEKFPRHRKDPLKLAHDRWWNPVQVIVNKISLVPLSHHDTYTNNMIHMPHCISNHIMGTNINAAKMHEHRRFRTIIPGYQWQKTPNSSADQKSNNKLSILMQSQLYNTDTKVNQIK